MYRFRPAFALFLLLFCLFANGQTFAVLFSPSASKESLSGNVFLYLSRENKNPKDARVGRAPFPCFRITVSNIQPGEPVSFDDAAMSFPVPISDIERGDYYVQAVWDKDGGGRTIGNSPGNIYNSPLRVRLTKDHKARFTITCQEIVKEPAFTETKFRKEIKQPSALLSRFYKKPVTIDAAVLLPKEYDEQPERRFPVLYVVLGFGGDYHNFSGVNEPAPPIDTTPCIRVVLDGRCSQGHSVYANSVNNGPWGDALMTELLPAIEKRFRCNAARLLTGHSSGGWASLWLQVNYPQQFVATWSRSPDPVDFRSFIGINLYADKNLFFHPDSSLRMVATVAGRLPWASMKLAYGMENVLSRGEQMQSFNAVFSERGGDGNPGRICDPLTGEIDAVTLRHWKAYDISLLLQANWQRLQPYLQNKVLVTVGNHDNFFLNESVKLLEKEMKKLLTGFVFAYYPGDHFTLTAPEYFQAGYGFLQEKYQAFIHAGKTTQGP